MKKITLILSILAVSFLITSCGGPASEATDICECFEKAKNDNDRDLFRDCQDQAKELKEKYKDDEDALQEIGEACGIF